MSRNTAKPLNGSLLLAGGQIEEDICAPSIGRVFRKIRRNLGLSHRCFAACLEVDYQWLSKLEADRLEISDQVEEQVRALLPELVKMIPEIELKSLEELPIVYRKSDSAPAFVCYARGIDGEK